MRRRTREPEQSIPCDAYNLDRFVRSIIAFGSDPLKKFENNSLNDVLSMSENRVLAASRTNR
jgi:hypothetical protein